MTRDAQPSSFDPASWPAELQPLGVPLSIHRPRGEVAAELDAKLLKGVGQFLGGRTLDAGALQNWGLTAFGGFLVLAGLGMLGIRLVNPPAQEREATALLILAALALLMGTALVGAGVYHLRRAARGEAPTSPGGGQRTYLVYNDGLGVVAGDSASVVRWSEVKVLARKMAGLHRLVYLVDDAGREVVLDRGVADETGLIQAVTSRVTARQVARALETIKGGK